VNKQEIRDLINSKCKIIKDDNRETDVLINGHHLRYIKNGHKYIVDGYETLSVTQLIKRTNPFLYKGVDKTILDKGSRRGDRMHEAIEYYERTGQKGFSDEFNGYLYLKDKYKIEAVCNELFVLICNNKNEPLCAGRLDMLYYENNDTDNLGICDFKRTYELYIDNVTLQLNLYKYGFEQTYGIKISKLMCMRLRDMLRECVSIKVDTALAESAMLAYL